MTTRLIQKVTAPRSASAVRRLGLSASRILRLPKKTETTLAFIGDAEMRQLNRAMRGFDKPTDVLSFPLHVRRPYRPDADGVVRLGDIVISVPTARRQAKARGARVEEELDELFVHGLLHLVGYDHKRPKDADRMCRTAERILQSP